MPRLNKPVTLSPAHDARRTTEGITMPCSGLSHGPAGPTRRALMLGSALGLITGLITGPISGPFAPVRPAAAQAAPELSVTQALRLRRSTRAFADRALDAPILAQLLWAAFGINRPRSGLHTAPSWRGAADTVIHVAFGDGVWVYDPLVEALRMRHDADIRAILSPQPFVATAPVCLLHISDLRRLHAAQDEGQKRVHAQVDAAIIAQNVYLFAAARRLGTCLVGGFDGPAITAALDLGPQEYIAYIQPIGWPAD